MDTIRNSFREILRYPSAIVGLVIISLLVVTAIYAVIKIPYNQRHQSVARRRERLVSEPQVCSASLVQFLLQQKTSGVF